MRSFVDAFAHQQLDGMQELRRDFRRRQRSKPAPGPVADRRPVTARPRSRVATGLRGIAVRLHLAGHA